MKLWLPIVLLGCASTPPPPVLVPTEPPPKVVVQVPKDDAVPEGELPWWHGVEANVYQLNHKRALLAVGRSVEHHHAAEGYLAAKVSARLALRKVIERVTWPSAPSEPELLDLFITRDGAFWALYATWLPENASSEAPRAISPPDSLGDGTRRRVGRHVFEGRQHLFLECDVEGPIANPDWGRSRASASL